MTSLMNYKKAGHEKGFTLLELLIVIAIIAILSIALVFMLNPAETLKKARDAQRISDLKTVKTALGVWLTSTSTPRLDTATILVCTTDINGNTQTPKIAYSGGSPTNFAVQPTTPASGGDANGTISFSATVSTSTAAGKVDGTGWIPVNLKALISGTPISAFPVDPTNTVTGIATSTDLVYRYACQNGSPTGSSKPAYIFEIDAVLESNAYTSEDNKMKNDGGDNDKYYEQGNTLNLLPLGPAGGVSAF